MLRPIRLLHSLARVALFVWFGSGLMAALACEVRAAEIVILKSSDAGYYSQAVHGFRQALPAHAHLVEYTVPERTTDAREVQSIRAVRPAVGAGGQCGCAGKGEGWAVADRIVPHYVPVR